MQALALMLRSHCRNFAGGRVHASVGDPAQPGPDARIGGIAIDLQSFGAELARQRHVEARAR